MSVKDRWVDLREHVLNVPAACWWYGPSKPNSLASTDGGFTPTTSMADSGGKLGTDPRVGLSSCCGLCWKSFFSGAVTLSIAVDDFMKGCYVLTAWDMYGLGPYTDWARDACDVLVRFPLQGVHRFESPWLLDMRTACSWQSSHS
jgi:hypothetical protein